MNGGKQDAGTSGKSFDIFKRCCIVANLHLQQEAEEHTNQMLHNGGSDPKRKDKGNA
jgi:hypothetical protein